MEYETQSVSNLLQMGKQYFENKIEYAELKAVSKVSRMLANIITETVVVLSVILAFLFASVTLGFWLSGLLDSFAQGFGLVSLFYIIMAIVVGVTKDKYIEKFIINRIIKKYSDGQEKDNK